MEHTKKELVRAGLKIRYRFGDGGILAEMNQVGTAYSAKRELQEEKADCLIACWNEHDTLKAFVGEIKDYFVDNCEDCKIESLAEYGEHGKERCKSCLSGRLLATSKELQ